MLAGKLDLLEPTQIAQAKVEDCVGLPLVELEPSHQRRLRLVLLTDDADDLVDVEEGLEIALEHLEPAHDTRQTVPAAAKEDLEPVRHEGAEHVTQPHDPRYAAGVEHVHVEPEPDLEIGGAEELLHQELVGHGARARDQDEAHLLGRLVAHVAQERQLLLVQELGNTLDQPTLRHLPGDLGDHDLVLALAQILPLPARPQAEAAAPGPVRVLPRCLGLDEDTAGRQVRALHVLEELLDLGRRRAQRAPRHPGECRQELARIVRRDRGRHADGDAGRPVGEQVGEGRRQDDGLVLAAVIGRPEVDRILGDAVEECGRDGSEPALGVPHGGGVIAIDIAEIALPVDQRIALGEDLGQADQRVVDRGVTVRVVLADDVADHARAFLEAARGVEAELEHGVEQPPLHGLEPVAHVGQGTTGDRRECIGQIALGECGAEIDDLGLALRCCAGHARRPGW